MGEIADDCFDRAMNELMDSNYGEEDYYEGHAFRSLRRAIETPGLHKARVKCEFDDLTKEPDENDFDLSSALEDAVQKAIWNYGERDVRAIVNAVMQLLSEHDYI